MEATKLPACGLQSELNALNARIAFIHTSDLYLEHEKKDLILGYETQRDALLAKIHENNNPVNPDSHGK